MMWVVYNHLLRKYSLTLVELCVNAVIHVVGKHILCHSYAKTKITRLNNMRTTYVIEWHSN